MRKMLRLALLVLTATATAAVNDLPPQPRNYVEDRAAILSADYKSKLNSLLKELEQKTGAQLIVLTVGTTQPLTIERFSIELAERWKLGRKDRDDGFLFTVAVQDRAFRFEVGYGLEEFLTDQFCGRVGRDILVPQLRQGRSSEGIYQVTLAIADSIARHNNVTLTGIPSGYTSPISKKPQATPLCGLLPIILFAVFILAAGRGSPFWLLWLLLGGASNNYGNGSWGGRSSGGFHSGGFGGGFGGGGGGGFGGGGFSGKW